MMAVPALAKPSCDQVLSACDAALNAEIHENQLQKQLIQDLTAKNKLDEDELHRIQDKDSGLFRQPWFWAGVGAVLGGYVVVKVRQ